MEESGELAASFPPASKMRVLRFAELESRLADSENRSDLLIDREFSQAFTAAVVKRLEETAASILSLDVFDTLLLRNDKSELRRFYEIAGCVSARLSALGVGRAPTQADVLVARYVGTLASYRLSAPVAGCREGAIDEIWRLAVVQLGLDPKIAGLCIDEEIAYEVENLEVNPLLLAIAKQHVASGGSVCLLSDMYLPARHILRIVEKLAIDTEFAAIVSSADVKVSKRSGGVFSVMEARLVCEPRQVLHIGDSYVGDYLMPRLRGWQAIHLPVSVGERRRRAVDDLETRRVLRDAHGLSFPHVERPI